MQIDTDDFVEMKADGTFTKLKIPEQGGEE